MYRILYSALLCSMAACADHQMAAAKEPRHDSHEQDLRSAGPTALLLPAMWEYSSPLISPEKRARNPSHAQKDPSVVFHGGKWHVFMTVKLPGRS